MPTVRKNSDIVKGSALQVKIGNDDILGFATSHSLSITVNTTEVSSKDHGDYPGVIKQNTTWEVTCENLFCGENWGNLNAYLDDDTPVTVEFVPVNYISKGIVYDNDVPSGAQTSWTAGTAIASGPAYLTSLSLNAGAGDNATVSATFTGAGPLTFANYVDPNA